MINKKGKKLLNLEDSVLELIRLVEGHYEVDRVVASYGITMVNDPIQNPMLLEGLRGKMWGEAYPVGYAPPYDIYIWTRPSIDTTDVSQGSWFNVGTLAIPGPKGEQGEKGEKGDTGHSTRWYIGDTVTEVESPVPGDIFLNSSTGYVYIFNAETGWGLPRYNLIGPRGPQGITGPKGEQGPQGPQGAKGAKGDTAPIITLMGVLSSIEELPEPSPSYLGRGYILSSGGINTVYTCVETAISGQYEWIIAGPVSGFSMITEGGTIQPMWNADTKLDKDSSQTQYNQVYVKSAEGGQGTINVTKQVVSDAIPQRKSDGNILVPIVPAEAADATSRHYVDDGLDGKVSLSVTSTTFPQVYCKSAAGGAGGTQMRNLISDLASGSDAWTNHAYTVAQRDSAGALRGPDPVSDTQYATKRWVLNNAGTKLYRHNICCSLLGIDTDGNYIDLDATFECLSTKSTPITSPYSICMGLGGSVTQSITVCPADGTCEGSVVQRLTIYTTGFYAECGIGGHIEEVYNAVDLDNGGITDRVTPVL